MLIDVLSVNIVIVDPASYSILHWRSLWGWWWIRGNLYINLSVCLFVCLYPINVKTAEPIGPEFFVGSRVTPGKFMDDQIFKICLYLGVSFSLVIFESQILRQKVFNHCKYPNCSLFIFVLIYFRAQTHFSLKDSSNLNSACNFVSSS